MTTRTSPILTAVLAAAALTGAAVVAGPALADEVATPELIAANCFNCHGPDGMSAGVTDSLEGLTRQALAKKLREFRDGSKPSTIMKRIAKGYTDAEIDAVSAYFGSLKK